MVLKVSIAAGIVVAFLAAFLCVRSGDEVAVRGTSAVMTVWDTGPELTRAQARQLIGASAGEADLTLYRSILSVDQGRTIRGLSLVNEGADRSLPRSGQPYRDFSRSVETRFAPPRAADESPGGTYLTGGSKAALDEVVHALNSRGMHVTTRDFGPVAVLVWTSEIVPLVPLLFAALLGMTLGCVHSTVGLRRHDAVLRVNGATRGRIVLGHVGTSILTSAICGGVGLVLAVPALGLYNGLAQFDRFVGAAVVGLVVVALFGAAAVFAVSLAEARVSPLAALGGERPLRRLAALGWAGHTAAVALVLYCLASVVATGLPAAENRRDAAEWMSSNYKALEFRLNDREFRRSEGAIAAIGRTALENGAALMVSGVTGPTEGHGPDHGNSMVVNDRYLSEQVVRRRSGERVDARSIRPGALTLLVPSQLLGEREALVAEYREWVRFQGELGGAAPDASRVPIDVIPTRDGQDLFTYETREPSSRQRDPVVAVVPSKPSVFSDDWIGVAMSSGGLLFSDGAVLRSELAAAGLDTSVVVESVGDLAAVRQGEQEMTARASAFAGLLAGVVALLAAGILATAIVERNRRIDFVRSIHGAAATATVGLPVAAVGVTGAITLGLGSLAGFFETPGALPASATVVAADVVIVGVLLVIHRRRLRADTLHRS